MNKMNLKEEMKRAELFQVKIYKAAAHLAKKQNVKSVLDLGCSYPTKVLRYVYPIVTDIVGVDLPEKIKLIQDANKSMNFHKYGKWIIHNFNESKKLNLHRKFDMIISADVIEHLEKPDRLLNAIKRHSHVKTIILLSTPDAESTMKQQDGSPANIQHIREWKMSEFIHYLTSSGFDIIDFGGYIEFNAAYPYICNYFLCRISK